MNTVITGNPNGFHLFKRKPRGRLNIILTGKGIVKTPLSLSDVEWIESHHPRFERAIGRHLKRAQVLSFVMANKRRLK
jgi:hypothetical protein